MLTAAHRIELRDFPLPEIDDDDGLLRIELAGVCGSDIHHWDGHSAVCRNVPALLGHEIVGRIEQVGAAAATRWEVDVGDRVIVEASFGCGRCEWCRRGSYQICADERGYGGRISAADPPHLWGAYGQFLYLPPRARVHRVSETITPATGVVIGAVLANGIRWVRTLGNAGIGDTVVVFGPGPQGLAATIAAHAAGARQIIAVGLARDRTRLDLAEDFGAGDTLVASNSTVAEIAELTRGRLADVVIDVTASPQAAGQAALVVRPLGTFVMAGSKGGAPVELPWDELVRRRSAPWASTAMKRKPSVRPSSWPRPGATRSNACSPTACPWPRPPRPSSWSAQPTPPTAWSKSRSIPGLDPAAHTCDTA